MLTPDEVERQFAAIVERDRRRHDGWYRAGVRVGVLLAWLGVGLFALLAAASCAGVIVWVVA